LLPASQFEKAWFSWVGLSGLRHSRRAKLCPQAGGCTARLQASRKSFAFPFIRRGAPRHAALAAALRLFALRRLQEGLKSEALFLPRLRGTQKSPQKAGFYRCERGL